MPLALHLISPTQRMWDSCNEGQHLQASVEKYKEWYGYYLEAAVADQIYRIRKNHTYCKKHGIRLSGPNLGRLSKDEQLNAELKQIERQDGSERSAIEGKFGERKRYYGLGLISTCLQQTS